MRPQCGQVAQPAWPKSPAIVSQVRGPASASARLSFAEAAPRWYPGCLLLYSWNTASPSLHRAVIDAAAYQFGSSHFAGSSTALRYHAQPSTIAPWSAGGSLPDGRRFDFGSAPVGQEVSSSTE